MNPILVSRVGHISRRYNHWLGVEVVRLQIFEQILRVPATAGLEPLIEVEVGYLAIILIKLDMHVTVDYPALESVPAAELFSVLCYVSVVSD